MTSSDCGLPLIPTSHGPFLNPSRTCWSENGPGPSGLKWFKTKVDLDFWVRGLISNICTVIEILFRINSMQIPFWYNSGPHGLKRPKNFHFWIYCLFKSVTRVQLTRSHLTTDRERSSIIERGRRYRHPDMSNMSALS